MKKELKVGDIVCVRTIFSGGWQTVEVVHIHNDQFTGRDTESDSIETYLIGHIATEEQVRFLKAAAAKDTLRRLVADIPVEKAEAALAAIREVL